MSEPTHATIATFRMDMSREDEQRRGLHEFLVPRVSQHAGFLGGTWMLDREAAQTVVVVTFGSRRAAEAFQNNVEYNAANKAAAIELVEIRVLEVMASAYLCAVPSRGDHHHRAGLPGTLMRARTDQLTSGSPAVYDLLINLADVQIDVPSREVMTAQRLFFVPARRPGRLRPSSWRRRRRCREGRAADPGSLHVLSSDVAGARS